MKSLLGWKGYVASAGAGAIVAGLAVGVGQGWRYGEQVATIKAGHAQQLQQYADAYADASRKLIERQISHQEAVAALDTRYTKELTHANAEIDRLRNDVAAGSRLRVNAECPAPAAGMPATAGTAGVDGAAGPRLTGAAERDYFALRERIATADAMIAGLQGYVRDVCLAR